jgi:hypothetical protein
MQLGEPSGAPEIEKCAEPAERCNATASEHPWPSSARRERCNKVLREDGEFKTQTKPVVKGFVVDRIGFARAARLLKFAEGEAKVRSEVHLADGEVEAHIEVDEIESADRQGFRFPLAGLLVGLPFVARADTEPRVEPPDAP